MAYKQSDKTLIMMNQRLPAPSAKAIALGTTKGFSLLELMIAVAIVGILAIVAIPAYNGYITQAKQRAARSVLDLMPVLAETYRADNGMMCPACSANGAYTYSYSENDNGTVAVDTITPNFPAFRPKSVAEAATATLYHYQVVFTVAGCPAACQTSAIATAFPQANRGAPPGNIVSNTFN